MLIRILLCLFLAVSCCDSSLWAQEKLTYDPNQTSSKTFRKAEEAMLHGDYNQAIRLFERVLKISPELHAARRSLAKCFALLNNYPMAAQIYDELIRVDPNLSRVMYFEAADAHYKTGNHGRALLLFNQFEVLQDKSDNFFGLHGEKEKIEEGEYLEKLPSTVRACHVSLDSVKFLNIDRVENMGPSINSHADEYFPCLSNDQKTLFYTRRRNKNADENLFTSTFEKDRWTDSSPVGARFNSPEHEGMSTLVRNERVMFYTACNREGVMGTCDIWMTNVDGLQVAEGGPLEGYANSDSWDSQAAISCDGSTLFFASNREGGYGRTDLWYSTRMADGRWNDPINLGPKINTEGYEEAPFITNDGQTLYFSSSGHLGMGEGDIFMSRLGADGKWGEPVNLGPPVNSAFHELGFFLSADGKTGYFASDRTEDGLGGMDIFNFHLTEQLYHKPITFVEGQVKDAMLDIPLQALVNIKGKGPIETDEEGRFFFCIPAEEELDITVNKKWYRPYSNLFPIPKWDNREFYILDIRLQPVSSESGATTSLKTPEDATETITKTTVKIQYHHTVFFEFDKADMKPNELQNINSFMKPLLEKQITRVEIIGYADDVGTDVYNMKLSEERAKKIALILLENDIIVDKIYLEGRGEIKDDRPKDQNRKVEVRIITQEERD